MVVSLKNVFHHGQDFHTTQKWEAKVYGVNNKKIVKLPDFLIFSGSGMSLRRDIALSSP